MEQYQANSSLIQSLPMDTNTSNITKSQLMDIKELDSYADLVKYIRHFKCLYDFDYVRDDDCECGKEPNFDLKYYTLNLLLNYTKKLCKNDIKMKQFIYQVVESGVYELFEEDLNSIIEFINKKGDVLSKTQHKYVYRVLWLFTNIYGHDFKCNFDILKLGSNSSKIKVLVEYTVILLACNNLKTITQAGWCLTNIIGDSEMVKLTNIGNDLYLQQELMKNLLYALNKTTYNQKHYKEILWMTYNLFRTYECLLNNEHAIMIISQIKTVIDNTYQNFEPKTKQHILKNYSWMFVYIFQNITAKRYKQLCSIGLTVEYMVKFAFKHEKYCRQVFMSISAFAYKLSMPDEIMNALKSVNFSMGNYNHVQIISKKHVWPHFMKTISNVVCDKYNDTYTMTVVDNLMSFTISNDRINVLSFMLMDTSFVSLFETLCIEYVNGNLLFDNFKLIQMLVIITENMLDEKPFIEGDVDDINNTYVVGIICESVNKLVDHSSNIFNLYHITKFIDLFNGWINRCHTDTTVLEQCIINLENHKRTLTSNEESESESESEDSES